MVMPRDVSSGQSQAFFTTECPWRINALYAPIAACKALCAIAPMLADAQLQSQDQGDAQVPKGCLLRRVNADVNRGEAFEDPLLMAGYRADRPSVWALQVCLLQSIPCCSL